MYMYMNMNGISSHTSKLNSVHIITSYHTHTHTHTHTHIEVSCEDINSEADKQLAVVA